MRPRKARNWLSNCSGP